MAIKPQKLFVWSVNSAMHFIVRFARKGRHTAEIADHRQSPVVLASRKSCISMTHAPEICIIPCYSVLSLVAVRCDGCSQAWGAGVWPESPPAIHTAHASQWDMHPDSVQIPANDNNLRVSFVWIGPSASNSLTSSTSNNFMYKII